MLRTRARVLALAAIGVAGGLAVRALAQVPESSPAITGQTFTLGATARLVIEDVLVTDSKGDPVKGLPESAFHVRDNGAAQQIAAFDESSREGHAMAPATRPGVFSNASQLDSQGQTVVLLIDTVGMEIPDQMYLRLQLHKYLASVPNGLQVAVFRTYGGGSPLLVQSLTTDRGLVAKAIDGSIPSIPRKVDSGFSNAVAEVANISQYLGQMPGRKQLIWFSGKFPLFISPISSLGSVQQGELSERSGRPSDCVPPLGAGSG